MDESSTFFLYIIVDCIALLSMGIANITKPIGFDRKNIVTGNFKISLSLLFMMISFLILFVLASFRDYVGRDYGTYVSIFYSVGGDNLYEGERTWLMQSPLFFLLCKVLSVFTDEYLIMFAVISFITLFFFYKAIHDISINWFLSLYLLLCFCLYYQSFNQIRQMTAVAIIAYSYKFLIRDDIKRFFLTVFIASTFHMSALIFGIIWPLRKMKMSVKNLVFYFLIGIGLFILFDRIVDLLSFVGYVKNYSGDENFSAAFTISTVLNFIVRLALFFFCLIFYKLVTRRYSYSLVYYNLAVICTIAQIGAIKFSIFGRLTTYFFLVYVFLLPEVFKVLADRLDKMGKLVFYIFILIAFAVYFLVYYFSPNGAEGGGYLIYSSWI